MSASINGFFTTLGQQEEFKNCSTKTPYDEKIAKITNANLNLNPNPNPNPNHNLNQLLTISL